MALTADDGTVLKPKEGVVLDRDGQPLTAGYSVRHSIRSTGFTIPLPAALGAVLFIPLALVMGAAFVSVVGILLVVFFVVRGVSRLFR